MIAWTFLEIRTRHGGTYIYRASDEATGHRHLKFQEWLRAEDGTWFRTADVTTFRVTRPTKGDE